MILMLLFGTILFLWVKIKGFHVDWNIMQLRKLPPFFILAQQAIFVLHFACVKESSCQTIHMEMCSPYRFKLSFIWRTRFETEAQINSEMIYIFSSFIISVKAECKLSAIVIKVEGILFYSIHWGTNFLTSKQVFYTDKLSVVIQTVLFLYSLRVQKAIKGVELRGWPCTLSLDLP